MYLLSPKYKSPLPTYSGFKLYAVVTFSNSDCFQSLFYDAALPPRQGKRASPGLRFQPAATT